MVQTTAPTVDDVRDAVARVSPHVHRTPVVTCRALDIAAGAHLLIKCENLQRVGAFKIRGATNLIAQLTADELARGVITHSSGNHAQAVALAAAQAGGQATVVMPENAPLVKRRATEGYGATVVSCAPTQASREGTVERLRAESGATLIHPYNDARIIAGAGTAALELLEQARAEGGPLDAVVVPIGGGGLSAGTTLACSGDADAPRVIIAEPTGADDACRSLETGVRVAEQTPRTICDGLLTCVGPLPFAVLSAGAGAGQVAWRRATDEAILHAMRLIWERAKLVVEPSAAVTLAVLLDGGAAALGLDGKRVGLILSGGNLDLAPQLDALGTRAREIAATP